MLAGGDREEGGWVEVRETEGPHQGQQRELALTEHTSVPSPVFRILAVLVSYGCCHR